MDQPISVTIEQGLREIAKHMLTVTGGPFEEQDYYEVVRGSYENMCRHYGEQMDVLDDEAILRVIRSQINELLHFGRANKLVAKRKNIPG